MDCKQIKKRLSAYQDGELMADVTKNITDHLRQCESCRTEAERLQHAYQWLGEGIRLPADAFFIARLRAKMISRSEISFRPAWQQWMQRALLPATVMIGLFIGIQLGIQLSQNWQVTSSSTNGYIESEIFSEVPQNSLTANYLALNGWKEGTDEE